MPRKSVSDGRDAKAALVLSIFFVISAVGGALTARFSGAVSAEAARIADGTWTSPSVWVALADSLKYPAVIFLMGFGALGAVAIPLAVAVKGFFLSFSVTSCAMTAGYWSAAALEGPMNLFLLPCIFALACDGFGNSLSVFAMSTGIGRNLVRQRPDAAYYSRAAASAALAVIAFLMEFFVSPMLLGK